MKKPIISLLSFVFFAAPAMADDFDYLHGGVVYNPARHEYVVVFDKLGYSEDGLSNSDQLFLRRIRTDGTVVGDVKLTEASTQIIGEPAIAYDPGREKLLVVWTDEVTDGRLRGTLVDAASYVTTTLPTIHEDPNLFANPIAVVFNAALDAFQVGFDISGVPTVVTVSAAGTAQSVAPAISGMTDGEPDRMAMAPGSGSAIMTAARDATGLFQVAPFDVNDDPVAATTSFNAQVNVVYLGANANKFMATYPGAEDGGQYPLKARLLTPAGAPTGPEMTLASDMGEDIAQDVIYHSGRDRVLYSYWRSTGEIVVKQATSAGSTKALGVIPAAEDSNHYGPRLAGESVCNTALLVYGRDEIDLEDYTIIGSDFVPRVFGTPCPATLTAEPNPLPFSDVGRVSVRANRGAFKVKSAKIVDGAESFQIVGDQCTGKLVRRDQRCELKIKRTGMAARGKLRVTSDAATSLDIELVSGDVTLTQVAPSDGALSVDPAKVSLIWGVDGGADARFKVSVCTDAQMTQCQTSSSVVRARQ